MIDLRQRDFLKLLDFTPSEIQYLLNLSLLLKSVKKEKKEIKYLNNKNIVLLFEKDSTRTRCSFEVAAYDQGAHVTYIGALGSQMQKKESMADTARVLSRLYDGIQYRGYDQDIVEKLAEYSMVPVWNGLTNEYHPTQILADFMTMFEHARRPLNKISFAYLGDARNNMGNSLMLGAAKMGMDFRSIAPKHFQTIEKIQNKAQSIAQETGAKITITDNIADGVKGCDFLYTDVWVSMGENESLWPDRIKSLSPYAVTRKMLEATQNNECKFLHCLPAFHNRETETGEKIFQKYGLEYMEVDDDIFESKCNISFDGAENRMHTIKAVMVATISDELVII